MLRPAIRVARTAGVLVLGALGLHQLSYLLAHGGGAGEALARGGHGYLDVLGPGLLAAAAVALLATAVVAAVAPRRSRGLSPVPIEARAAIFAVAFIAVFATQELAEGVLVADHPHGLAALSEAWVAVPLAIPIGALAALALGGLETAERLIASVLAAAPRRRRTAAVRAISAGAATAGTQIAHLPLAFGLARRGPPATP